MIDLITCSRCVMNNSSDNTIKFDKDGICDYCTKAYNQIGEIYYPDESGKEHLENLLAEVKYNGRNKKYDCIMGISGGLDSSYLAYLGYKWGLKVLLIHVDDGFDSDITKSNLEKLVSKVGFDYIVIKPDKTQYAALIKAYMRASVPNIAIPQDNVLFASIYKYMRKNRINYFLSGGNFALESILQRGNTYKVFDLVNMKDINRKFGSMSISKLTVMSTLHQTYDKMVLKIQTPRPLNYIEYNSERAYKELDEFCGYQYYGGKHLENILTSFIQLFWFPKKFGVDKRTSHLSSMIVSGQMTREDALSKLSKPLYDEKLMRDYINIVKEKLVMADSEFDEIMDLLPKQHNEYKVEDDTLKYKFVISILERLSFFKKRLEKGKDK